MTTFKELDLIENNLQKVLEEIQTGKSNATKSWNMNKVISMMEYVTNATYYAYSTSTQAKSLFTDMDKSKKDIETLNDKFHTISEKVTEIKNELIGLSDINENVDILNDKLDKFKETFDENIRELNKPKSMMSMYLSWSVILKGTVSLISVLIIAIPATYQLNRIALQNTFVTYDYVNSQKNEMRDLEKRIIELEYSNRNNEFIIKELGNIKDELRSENFKLNDVIKRIEKLENKL